MQGETKRKSLKKERKCTDRQLNFITYYIRNGGDVINAYLKAFSTKDVPTAYNAGNKILKLPWVDKELRRRKVSLDKRAVKMGLDDTALLDQHKKLVFAKKTITIKKKDKEGNEITEEREVDDLPMIKQGLELVYKLLGKFAAERKAFEGPGGKALFPETDFSKMGKDELEAKKKELIKVLQGEE